MQLQLFTDGTDFIIAESAKDAVKLWEEEVGESYEEDCYDPFEPLPDDGTFTMWYYKGDWLAGIRGDLPEGAVVEDDEERGKINVTAPVSAWIALCGRCYLASTEY